MTDAELLKEFGERRDEAAFAEIVRRHGPMVLGVCRRMLSNVADAEDAFQATFLLLAMKATKIRDSRLLGNWLFGAAARIAANSRRATQRRQRLEKRLMQMAQPTPPSSDPVAEREMLRRLDTEIHRLAFKLRSVVVLCYLEGKTKAQAAQQLGWPEGTVATRLAEARRILRKRLQTAGIDASADVLSVVLAQSLVAAPVPPALIASTAKAVALVSAGKAAAAGAVSAKVLSMANGASKAIVTAKVKLVALIVMGFGLTLGVGAAVSQSKSAPNVQKRAQAPPAAPRAQSESEISATRTLRILMAIDLYTNEHDGHFPPDLGSTVEYLPAPVQEKGRYYVLPVDEPSLIIPESPSSQWINEHTSFVYLADQNLAREDLRKLKPEERPIALIYQRPRAERGHPITIGFGNSSAAWFAPVLARQYIERSLASVARVRQLPPPRVKTLEGFLPDLTPQFAEPILPAEKKQLPDVLRQALLQNAASVGPLSLEWIQQGVADSGADFATANYFIDDGYFEPWHFRAAWQAGKTYGFSRGPKGNIHEGTFDGSQVSFTNFVPKIGLLKRSVYSTPLEKVETRNPGAVSSGGDFFESAGLHLPATAKQLADGHAQPQILKMLDDGATLVDCEEARLDGEPMWRVTLVGDNAVHANLNSLPRLRTYVFWLDPQMNYALRRLEQKYAEQPVEMTTNDRFERLPGRSVWFPRRSRTDCYTFHTVPDQFFDHPIVGKVLEVSKMTFEPIPADRFVLLPEVPAEFSAASDASAATAGEATPTSIRPAATPPRAASRSAPFIMFGALAGIVALALLGRVALARRTTRRQRP